MNARSRLYPIFSFFLILAILAAANALPAPAQAAPRAAFLVGGSGDAPDINPGDGVCSDGVVCTLRAAIMEANATAGQDTITFNNNTTIALGSTLPALTDPAGTVIYGGNRTVYIHGFSAPAGTDGFVINSNYNKIQGMILWGLDRGIIINPFTSYNTIGVDGDGVHDADEQMTIGLGNIGIEVIGSYNYISGNHIGVSDTGLVSEGNAEDGIVIRSSAVGNWIGVYPGSASDNIEYNLISDNGRHGIFIDGGDQNLILGNRIGLSGPGSSAFPNGQDGIYVGPAAENNRIGLYMAHCGNIISGNDGNGIRINANNNRVESNLIGLDLTGALALPNQGSGVLVVDGSGNTIGTNGDGSDDAAEGNTISGNAGAGVSLTADSFASKVMGNYIGVNLAHSQAVPNLDGVEIVDTTYANIVGTDANGVSDALEANLISGNSRYGILVQDTSGNENYLRGNLIGSNLTGNLAIPNGSDGIHAESVSDLIIGGTSESARNLISYNGGSGIYITSAADLTIQGNYIGVTENGIGNAGNDGSGIWLAGVTDSTIGGVETGAANRIYFNDGDGIYLSTGANVAWRGNKIQNNGGLGLDLGADGVTANDPFDADSGANGLQNYPSLDTADSGQTTMTVAGALVSKPSRTYTLDFYYISSCDASGHGEGVTYLGSHEVTTSAAGTTSFSAVLNYAPAEDTFVTATATGAEGTSEFSACVEVARLPLAPLVTTGAATNITDVSAQLNATVNPFDAAATAYFQLTTVSGNYTAAVTIAASPSSIPANDPTGITGQATGLEPDSTYFYRAVAVNANGTSYGSEQPFTTASLTLKAIFLPLSRRH